MSSKDKKNKFIFNSFFKLIVLIILIILIVYLSFTILFDFIRKHNLEKTTLPFAKLNEKTIFSIDKILLFSSANASNVNAKSNGSWTLDVNQYSDIAIYINSCNSSDTFTDENTIKKLTIDNIKIGQPELGNPSLFYKDLNNFAKYIPLKEFSLLDSEKFEYTIIPFTGVIDYSKPQIYQTGNNPITFGYINSDIKNKTTISDTSSPLIYDGSLLKKAGVALSSISNTISFRINITNNLNQEYSTTLSLEIPVYDEGIGDYGNLYNGMILKHLAGEPLYRFYRYK